MAEKKWIPTPQTRGIDDPNVSMGQHEGQIPERKKRNPKKKKGSDARYSERQNNPGWFEPGI